MVQTFFSFLVFPCASSWRLVYFSSMSKRSCYGQHLAQTHTHINNHRNSLQQYEQEEKLLEQSICQGPRALAEPGWLRPAGVAQPVSDLWLLQCFQSRGTAGQHILVCPAIAVCTQPQQVTHLLLLELLAKLLCSLPSFFQFHVWFFQQLLLLLCFCQQVHSSHNHFFLQCRQFLQQGLVLLPRQTGGCETSWTTMLSRHQVQLGFIAQTALTGLEKLVLLLRV